MISFQIRNWLIAGVLSLPISLLQAQQPIKEKQVPQEIRDDFGLRFQEAEGIIWMQAGSEHFGARCKVKEADVEVVYGAQDGQWVQTTEEIAFLDMPEGAKGYCKEHYADFVAVDVQKVSTRRYGILYEIVVGKEQEQVAMTFDMHGKMLEEKKKQDEGSVKDPETPNAKERLSGIFKKQD